MNLKPEPPRAWVSGCRGHRLERPEAGRTSPQGNWQRGTKTAGSGEQTAAMMAESERAIDNREKSGGGTERRQSQNGRLRAMFDLREIMVRAWELYRAAEGISFSEALKSSWVRAKNDGRIHAAKLAAGVYEEVNTWSGWKKLGREVIHGSKALFGVDLIWASKGPGAIYKARFFGIGQTAEVSA